ncbi:hypothetical protein FRC03_000975 [Tulasnella sp. 419]|nr:hypothetical protein FRC03_000975 [Tulasnella sp. 419]
MPSGNQSGLEQLKLKDDSMASMKTEGSGVLHEAWVSRYEKNGFVSDIPNLLMVNRQDLAVNGAQSLGDR